MDTQKLGGWNKMPRNDNIEHDFIFFDKEIEGGYGDLDWDFLDSLTVEQKRHLWRLHQTNKIKIISTGLLLKLKKLMEEYQ